MIGTNNSEVLNGGNGADTIEGYGGSDTIFGNAGNDVLVGYKLDYDETVNQNQSLYVDYLYGGAGNDFYLFDRLLNSVPVVIEDPNGGLDSILGDLESFTLPAYVENYINDLNLTSNGVPVEIRINGNESNNVIKTAPVGEDYFSLTSVNETKLAKEAFYGYGGNDTLLGGGGNDLLNGGAGDDSLVGGEGSDTLLGESGNDSLIGGKGDDVLSGSRDAKDDWNQAYYVDATAGVSITLGSADGRVSTGEVVGNASVGTDTLINIDEVVGSSFADSYVAHSNWRGGQYTSWFTPESLKGQTLHNSFAPGGGDDTIQGNGYTRLAYWDSSAGIQVLFDSNVVGKGQVVATAAGQGVDTFEGVLEIRASRFADALIGGAGSQVFRPAQGNDTVDGGAGEDLISFQGSSQGVTVNLSITSAQAISASEGSDTIRNIEWVRGSGYGDVLVGDAFDNKLFGREGNDSLDGGNGTNWLEGGLGDDTLTGAARGESFLDWNIAGYGLDLGHGVDVTLGSSGSLASGTVTAKGDLTTQVLVDEVGRDTLLNIDAVRGTNQSDRFVVYKNWRGGQFDAVDLGLAFGEEFTNSLVSRATNELRPAGGDDVVVGNGFTRLTYTFDLGESKGITVNFSGLQAGTVKGLDSNGNSFTDSFTGVPYVKSTRYNDVLDASKGGDISLAPMGGADVIKGSQTNVTMVDYRWSESAVSVDLSRTSKQTVNAEGWAVSLSNVRAVRGSMFGDALIGGTADEWFSPREGNDTVSAGSGFDTVFYSSNRANYSVVVSEDDWSVTVTDNRSGSNNEGTDVLVGVERIRFRDQELSLLPDAVDFIKSSLDPEEPSESPFVDSYIRPKIRSVYGEAWATEEYVANEGDFSVRLSSKEGSRFDFSGTADRTSEIESTNVTGAFTLSQGGKIALESQESYGSGFSSSESTYSLSYFGDPADLSDDLTISVTESSKETYDNSGGKFESAEKFSFASGKNYRLQGELASIGSWVNDSGLEQETTTIKSLFYVDPDGSDRREISVKSGTFVRDEALNKAEISFQDMRVVRDGVVYFAKNVTGDVSGEGPFPPVSTQPPDLNDVENFGQQFMDWAGTRFRLASQTITGTKGDDTFWSSNGGRDTIDGGAGVDTLNLTSLFSFYGWSLGEGDYRLSGTANDFTLSWTGITGGSPSMQIKNVENVILDTAQGSISTSQFLAPSTELLTGADILGFLVEEANQDDPGLFVERYIAPNLGEFIGETWSAAEWNPDAPRRVFSSSSEQGSKLDLVASYSSQDGLDTDTVDLTFSSGRGDKLSLESVDTYGENSYEYESIYSVAYKGNLADLSDDLTISVTESSKETYDNSGGKFESAEKFSFASGKNYRLQGELASIGSWVNDSGLEQETTTIKSLFYVDPDGSDRREISVKSGTFVRDEALNKAEISFQDMRVVRDGVVYFAKNVTGDVSGEGPFPPVSTQPPDLNDVENFGQQFMDWAGTRFRLASQTITGTKGDDTFWSSNGGRDTIDGGAGVDTLNLSSLFDFYGWSLGEGDYRLSGSANDFTLSWTGITGGSPSMQIKNVENVILETSQGAISTAQFLAPNTTVISGGDLLQQIVNQDPDDADNTPFVQGYGLPFLEGFIGETWTSAEYNPDASSSKYSASSSQGSTLSLIETRDLGDGFENSTTSFGFKGGAGESLNYKSSTTDSWSNSGWAYSDSTKFDLTDKSEGLSISVTSSIEESGTDNSGKWQNLIKGSYADGMGYELKLDADSSGQWAYANGQSTQDTNTLIIKSLNYVSLEDDLSFSFKGSSQTDYLKGVDQVDFQNVTVVTEGVTYDTKTVKATLQTGSDDEASLENVQAFGNDFLNWAGDAILASNNAVVGSKGDDTLIGSTGFDTLDGGAGVDTLDLSEFGWTLEDRGSQTYQVRDEGKQVVVDHTAGQMVFKGIELVDLGGETVSMDKFLVPNADAIRQVLVDSGELGVYELTVGGYVIAEGGLGVSDVPLDALSLSDGRKGWAPGKSEEVAGVFEAFRGYELITVTDRGQSKEQFYSIAVDAAGVAGRAEKLDLVQVLEKEALYDVDLTGEGAIGDGVSTVLVDSSELGLYEMSSGGVAIAEGGLTAGDTPFAATLLSDGRKAWSLGKAEEAAGVFADNRGYELITVTDRGQSKEQFYSTAVDSQGIVDRAAKLDLPEVLALESQYNVDLTGEGAIGDGVSTVLVDSSELGLYEMSSGGVAIAEGGLTAGDTPFAATLLSDGRKAWSLGKAEEAAGVFADNRGYEVITVTDRGQSKEQFYSTAVDSQGIVDRAAKLDLPEVLALESQYNVDLTGEGAIGDGVSTVLVDSSELGLYEMSSGGVAIAEGGLTAGDTPFAATLLSDGRKAWSLGKAEEAAGVFGQGSGYELITVSDRGDSKKEQFYSTAVDSQGIVDRAAKLDLPEVLALESQYNVDLTGEGAIGDGVSTVLVDSSELGLYEMSSGGVAIAEGGLEAGDTPFAATLLSDGRKAWGLGKNEEATAVFETNQRGYAFEVITVSDRGGRKEQFYSTAVDSEGIADRADKLDLSEVLAKEALYNIDLTGEGAIGDGVSEVLADSGAFGVYAMSSGDVAIAEGGLTVGMIPNNVDILNDGRKAWSLGKNEEVAGVFGQGSGYELITVSDLGGRKEQFYSTAVSNTGVTDRAEKLDLAQVLAKEGEYQVDLNGDGRFGDTVVEVLADAPDLNAGLYVLSSGVIVGGDAGLAAGDTPEAYTVLSDGRKDFALPKGASVMGLVGLEGGEIQVVLESKGKYFGQSFGEDGVASSRLSTLSSSELPAVERALNRDLTGEGLIGAAENGKVKADLIESWQDEGSGSIYSLYKVPTNWSGAQKAAQSLGGELVALETEAESAAFFEKLDTLLSNDSLTGTKAKDGGDAAYVWLGGTDDARSKVDGASEGNWVWSDGSAIETDNWGQAEPDNFGGKQHYLAMGLEDWPAGTTAEQAFGLAGQFNDINGANKLYYVVEFGAMA